MNRRTRTSIIASVAVICVAVLAACASGAGSGNKLPEIPAVEAESNGQTAVALSFGYTWSGGVADSVGPWDVQYGTENTLSVKPGDGIVWSAFDPKETGITKFYAADGSEIDTGGGFAPDTAGTYFCMQDFGFEKDDLNVTYGVKVVITGDDSTDAQADPAYLNDIDADALTQGLEFETPSVSGRGSVHTRLTNIASPYTVTATDVFWVSDENGGAIRFSGVPLLSQLRTLGFGDSLYYGFEVGELDADMKPGNYFINTNVFISSDGGEPVVQTVSVLFIYREPLTAITPEDAENYAQKYVDALNNSEDLTGTFESAMESWRKWLGTDSPRFEVQPDSVKPSGSGNGYEFKVNSLDDDAIYAATVNITLDPNAIYYSEPLYFCAFTRYYPTAEFLVRDYIAALADSDVNALALVIAYDGTNRPDSDAKLDEARRSLDYYSARYDVVSLELSGELMYDDRGQLFQQVVLDKNGDGFVLSVTYDDMTVSVEPPEQ